MTEKVFLNDNKMATFVCQECGKSRTADVSGYIQRDRAIKLKVKCECGHSYSAFLERRQEFRKMANLSGEYIYSLPSGKVEKGEMTVKDVSRAGLRIKVDVMPHFKIGTTFTVEFRLDDKSKTLIRKDVIVRNMSDYSIGAEFCSISLSDSYDKALGFYLF